MACVLGVGVGVASINDFKTILLLACIVKVFELLLFLPLMFMLMRGDLLSASENGLIKFSMDSVGMEKATLFSNFVKSSGVLRLNMFFLILVFPFFIPPR